MKKNYEVLSLPEEGHYECKDILENIKKNDGVACFEMSAEWMRCGVEELNDNIDTIIESGWMLGDIGYQPLRVQNGEIIFAVACGETGEWVEEFDDTHLGDGV
jgi:hypothetical protein